MKTTYSKLLLLVFLVPAIGTAGTNPFTGKHTKTKKISKEFKVNSDATLFVDNSYGNIDITTWNENRIEIDVIIKTNGNDEEKVQKTLDAIQIQFSNSASQVTAKTILEKEDSSWWKIFSSSSNVNRQINYIVKMPISNNIDLENDYGNINISKLNGNARIDCDYGKMIIGELNGENNILEFDYTDNSQFGYIKRAKINADYSGFEIEEAGYIILEADYTSSKIEKITTLDFSCEYGSIEVGKVRKMTGEGDYLSTKIGEVYGIVQLSLDYGSLKIEKLTSETEKLLIDSDYTDLKIGYDAQLAFNFDIDLAYGDFRGLENMNIQTHDNSSTSNEYRGYHISQNSGKTIEINSDYGNVRLERK